MPPDSEQVPGLAVQLWYVEPEGTTSVATTPVAGTAPDGLFTVIVYVTTLLGVMRPFPSAAGLTSSAFPIVTAGVATSVFETPLLDPEKGPPVPLYATLAELEIVELPATEGVFAVTTRVRVAVP